MARQSRLSLLVPSEPRLSPRETLAGLRFIAERRGYKRGWVAHRYSEAFGYRPNVDFLPPPARPSAAVLAIVERWQAEARTRGKAGPEPAIPNPSPRRPQ